MQQVCAPCDRCDGLGVVKTPATTCVEIFRSILEDAQLRCGGQEREGSYLIRTGSDVVDRLLDEDAEHLARLAREIGREVSMQVEPSYGPGEYDVVLVQDMRRPG